MSAGSVTREAKGPITILRFSGDGSADLAQRIPAAFREVRHGAALILRDLERIDETFSRALIDGARNLMRRKRDVVLVEPPPKLAGAESLPELSCEGALSEGASLSECLRRDREAMAEIASRFQVNPLWRRVDQESGWLCPICGTEVEGLRIPNFTNPPQETLRLTRRHLMDRCVPWRGGRRAPLPATALDSFLSEINRRKAQVLHERVETIGELEHSMDAAKRRQMRLLPIDPEPDPVAEIAVVYRPLESVSGDFMDFYSLGDDRFGVAIGDVSGHGVEAGLVMGMAKMAFRIRTQALGTVREMMSYANRDLFNELRRAAFVTGFFGLIDRETRRLSYVRAGHPFPMLRRNADGSCLDLEGEGLPFGVDGGRRFSECLEQREVDLAPGDALLLFTDGITEAGTPDEFGEERVRDAFLSAAAKASSPREILDGVTGALDAFLGDTPLNDDVTLICLVIR